MGEVKGSIIIRLPEKRREVGLGLGGHFSSFGFGESDEGKGSELRKDIWVSLADLHPRTWSWISPQESAHSTKTGHPRIHEHPQTSKHLIWRLKHPIWSLVTRLQIPALRS